MTENSFLAFQFISEASTGTSKTQRSFQKRTTENSFMAFQFIPGGFNRNLKDTKEFLING
jgi:hypothetical protein